MLRLCLCLAAGPAFADCPGPDDLGTGIRLDLGGGDYSIVTKNADGAIVETEFLADLGEPAVYVMSNGVLDTAFLPPYEDEPEFYSYDFDLSAMLPLKPWASGEGTQTAYDAEGEELYEIGVTWRTRDMEDYQIGDCVYRALPLEVLQVEVDGSTLTEYRYLMDLGFPVIIGFYMDGAADLYPPQGISAVKE